MAVFLDLTVAAGLLAGFYVCFVDRKILVQLGEPEVEIYRSPSHLPLVDLLGSAHLCGLSVSLLLPRFGYCGGLQPRAWNWDDLQLSNFANLPSWLLARRHVGHDSSRLSHQLKGIRTRSHHAYLYWRSVEHGLGVSTVAQCPFHANCTRPAQHQPLFGLAAVSSSLSCHMEPSALSGTRMVSVSSGWVFPHCLRNVSP